MIGWLREMLLGNWRNKGVALFFAVTIWFVVFQSEKQDHPETAEVKLVPEDAGYLITHLERLDRDKEAYEAFDGRVLLTFSGPRKQIEDLRQEHSVKPLLVRLQIPPTAPGQGVDYKFRQEDFGFPRTGIEIIEFKPESIRITQEEEDTVVQRIHETNIHVEIRREGFEVASKTVDPPEVEIRGPKSIIHGVQPYVNVVMGYEQRDRFNGNLPVNLNYSPEIDDLVKRTVTVTPQQVNVNVGLKASIDTLAAEAVKIAFLLPPLAVPVKILVDDLNGETIPVEFYGPKDRIAELRRQMNESNFSLSVRVDPFEIEPGGSKQFTFTEEELELYGFPQINKRPHESRRSPKKPWTYRIVAAKEAVE